MSTKSTRIRIGDRSVGSDCPVYIIAELSANHRKSIDDAVELVKAAKQAGADAVKVQTFTPETMTVDVPDGHFFQPRGSLWEGRTLYSLYREASMPWDWQPRLKQLADELGVDFFSTPFDSTAVHFLEEMGVPAYKVASFEMVDLPLIKRIAETGKPLILSTGMARLSEIDDAVGVARNTGATQIGLLKCTSAYPAAPGDMNLKTIPLLSRIFDLPCGLSDHSTSIGVPIAAVGLGACMIEKHFTLSRRRKTLDSPFSLEPIEFKQMVEEIRKVEQAMGHVHFGPVANERNSMKFRRSLYIVRDLTAGDTLTADSIRSIRPGDGIAPKYLNLVIGKTIKQDARKGTPLRWELLL